MILCQMYCIYRNHPIGDLDCGTTSNKLYVDIPQLSHDTGNNCRWVLELGVVHDVYHNTLMAGLVALSRLQLASANRVAAFKSRDGIL